MDKIDFYIAVVPPWLGGNHLFNILRTNKFFYNHKCNQVQLDFYNQNKTRTVHSNKDYLVPIYTPTQIPGFLSSLAKHDRPCALRVHFGEMMLMREILKNYKFRIIFVDFPVDKNTISYKRFIQNHNLDSMFYSEQVLLTKPDVFSKLFEIPESDICNVSPDNLHNANIETVVYTLEQFIGVTFDLEIIQEMHTIWMKTAFKGIE
jgi:hypothetical protein